MSPLHVVADVELRVVEVVGVGGPVVGLPLVRVVVGGAVSGGEVVVERHELISDHDVISLMSCSARQGTTRRRCIGVVASMMSPRAVHSKWMTADRWRRYALRGHCPGMTVHPAALAAAVTRAAPSLMTRWVIRRRRCRRG